MNWSLDSSQSNFVMACLTGISILGTVTLGIIQALLNAKQQRLNQEHQRILQQQSETHQRLLQEQTTMHAHQLKEQEVLLQHKLAVYTEYMDAASIWKNRTTGSLEPASVLDWSVLTKISLTASAFTKVAGSDLYQKLIAYETAEPQQRVELHSHCLEAFLLLNACLTIEIQALTGVLHGVLEDKESDLFNQNSMLSNRIRELRMAQRQHEEIAQSQ